MEYKIWSGLAQNDAEFSALRQGWMPRRRHSLHDALYDAMMINDARKTIDGRQAVVWEIEGEDGSRISRQEIVDLVRKRKYELIANRPREY